MPVEQAGVPAQTNVYYVGTSATAGGHGSATFSILPGDVVVMSTAGLVNSAGSGGISLSGTGTVAIVGVAAQTAPLTPASQTAVLVYDDPDQVFIIQDAGTATAGFGSSANMIGLCYEFQATATGGNSQSTGGTARSAGQILSTTPQALASRVLAASATTQLPVIVMGIHPIEYTPNAAASSLIKTASGTPLKLRVKFNRHLWQTFPS